MNARRAGRGFSADRDAIRVRFDTQTKHASTRLGSGAWFLPWNPTIREAIFRPLWDSQSGLVLYDVWRHQLQSWAVWSGPGVSPASWCSSFLFCCLQWSLKTKKHHFSRKKAPLLRALSLAWLSKRHSGVLVQVAGLAWDAHAGLHRPI